MAAERSKAMKREGGGVRREERREESRGKEKGIEVCMRKNNSKNMDSKRKKQSRQYEKRVMAERYRGGNEKSVSGPFRLYRPERFGGASADR